ncbi:MAG: hypothetical protein H6860_02260 [Rhodospirillales bacterium]|nr:hypothetical protein [Alphaproteobacteria bacterium]MCB9981204.1 hypothetical protein [Rhodospirillales bacterium]
MGFKSFYGQGSMFSKHELQQNLLGTFEISLFMRSGVERFEVGVDQVLRSFLWPLVALPIALIVTLFLSEGYSPWLLLILHSVRILLTYALSLILVFFFCKRVNRMEFLYKYIIVQNWFELALLALIAPMLVCLSIGMPVEQVENYAVFITVLSYVYCGFILTYSLRIPWEMGGFIAVSFMFIDETAFDVLKFVRDTLFVT